MRRAVPTAGLAVLALLAVGLLAGSRAGGMPAPDVDPHTPAVVTGPTGRRALDGLWTVRVAGGGPPRRVRLPYSPNAGAVSGPAGRASFEGSVAWYRTTIDIPSTGD